MFQHRRSLSKGIGIDEVRQHPAEHRRAAIGHYESKSLHCDIRTLQEDWHHLDAAGIKKTETMFESKWSPATVQLDPVISTIFLAAESARIMITPELCSGVYISAPGAYSPIPRCLIDTMRPLLLLRLRICGACPRPRDHALRVSLPSRFRSVSYYRSH